MSNKDDDGIDSDKSDDNSNYEDEFKDYFISLLIKE
jgi:hypothetical protein